MDLMARVVLITGASTGIGRAAASRFAAKGAQVLVHGRDVARTNAAADEMGGRPLIADLNVAADRKRLVDDALAAFGRVDVLVNNLGIFGAAPALEITDAEWQRYWDVNVMAAVRLIRASLPGMKERGWGRVLNIASDSAIVTPAEMIHYGVSKTALLAVSRGFAKDAAGTGVTVNSVIAGPTYTEGVQDFVYELVDPALPWEEAEVEFMRRHRPQSLVQRLIRPEEIANMVVYLASPLASATTGGALRVDGGYTDAILP